MTLSFKSGLESHNINENQAKKSSQSTITNFFASNNNENVQDQNSNKKYLWYSFFRCTVHDIITKHKSPKTKPETS